MEVLVARFNLVLAGQAVTQINTYHLFVVAEQLRSICDHGGHVITSTFVTDDARVVVSFDKAIVELGVQLVRGP